MTDIAAPSSAPVTDSSDSWDDTPDTSKESDSFDDDSFDAPEEKPKAKATPKEDKPEPKPKKYVTAVVNGKEVRVTEEELIRHYQKERAAVEKFQKSSQIEKSTSAFMEALMKNPEKVLADPRLSIDRQKLAMQWLSEQVEEELADPKDKETQDLRKKLKEYEDRDLTAKQQAEQEAQQEEHKATVHKIQTQLSNTFQKAMELSPLAKDPETSAEALRQMAIEYRLAKRAGYEATPEELAQKVEQKYFKQMYSAASTLSGEDLLSFLGDAVVNKIRKADLQRLTGGQSNSIQKNDSWNEPKQQKSKSKESEYIDPSDVRLKLRDW